MNLMKTEYKLFFAVLAVKIIFLIVFLSFFGEGRLLWSDSTTYVKIGDNLFSGLGFSSPAETGVIPDTQRAPFYPTLIGFFNAFISHGFVFVSFLQAIAAAFIAVITYKIGRRFVSVPFSIAAALFISVEPLIASMHILIAPETFLVLFLLLWMEFMIRHWENGRWSDLIFSVVFLVLAIYTKPVAYYLIFVAGLVLLIQHRSFIKPVAAVACIFLLLSPWMLYNKSRAGTFAMTTHDTGNICSWELAALISTRYRLDSTDWLLFMNMPEYIGVQQRCTSAGAALSIFVREYPKEFTIATAISTAALLTNEGYSAFFEKPEEEQIKPHHNYLTPPVFINKDWPAKIRSAVLEMRPLERMAILLGKIMWAVIVLFAVLGVWRQFRKPAPGTLLLVLFLLYIIVATTISTGYGVGARLRFPIDPILLIFAMCGVEYLVNKYGYNKKLSGNN